MPAARNEQTTPNISSSDAYSIFPQQQSKVPQDLLVAAAVAPLSAVIYSQEKRRYKIFPSTSFHFSYVN